MMYQYFVKIVPTIYMKTDGEVSPKVYFLHSIPEILLSFQTDKKMEWFFIHLFFPDVSESP